MSNLNDTLKKLPDTPGIYLFYNIQKELVYVGKATSLRNRVGSYFRGARTSRPIEQMIHEVVDIKVKETDSVLEALILEGSYIKKYRPKYNVDWKDDKSWNYIVITDEKFPQVKTIRAHEYSQYEEKKLENARLELASKVRNLKLEKLKYSFGPYPGMKTRETMRLLEKLFFISTCKPDAKRDPSAPLRSAQEGYRPCLYRQMGQCLGVCTGEISPSEYRQKVIRPLTMFLRGNKKGVIKNLEQKMKVASKTEDFEEAARLRNQIGGLQKIHDIALLNNSFFDNEKGVRNKEKDFFDVNRIEGYDISNLGSTGKVGSMVVFDTSGPVKSHYRKFKIKTVEGQSDVDCLAEVLERRVRHDEWPLPNIFLIDGGKPQVNRAKQILQKYNIDIPVVGIAKGPDRKKNEFIFGTVKKDVVLWVNEHQKLLINVRDEAHRFAISYQKVLRKIK